MSVLLQETRAALTKEKEQREYERQKRHRLQQEIEDLKAERQDERQKRLRLQQEFEDLKAQSQPKKAKTKAGIKTKGEAQ